MHRGDHFTALVKNLLTDQATDPPAVQVIDRLAGQKPIPSTTFILERNNHGFPLDCRCRVVREQDHRLCTAKRWHLLFYACTPVNSTL